MAGVAAGLDHGDVHSLASQVVDRNLSEPRADTAPLILRVDADDVDDAHPFVEGVQPDGDETDRAAVHDGHEDVSVTARTTRSHGRSLIRHPVRVQAEKDVIAENVSHGREHGRPGAKRELDDRVDVVLGERADLDQVVSHSDRATVTRPSISARLRQCSGMTPEFAVDRGLAGCLASGETYSCGDS